MNKIRKRLADFGKVREIPKIKEYKIHINIALPTRFSSFKTQKTLTEIVVFNISLCYDFAVSNRIQTASHNW
jgi:hypothetical protein